MLDLAQNIYAFSDTLYALYLYDAIQSGGKVELQGGSSSVGDSGSISIKTG